MLHPSIMVTSSACGNSKSIGRICPSFYFVVIHAAHTLDCLALHEFGFVLADLDRAAPKRLAARSAGGRAWRLESPAGLALAKPLADRLGALLCALRLARKGLGPRRVGHPVHPCAARMVEYDRL